MKDVGDRDVTITMKVQDWEHIVNALSLFYTPTIRPLTIKIAASIMREYEREIKNE